MEKKPMEKGVARVPVIMQLETLECGAASLAMVMAYYGKWVPLEKLRQDCGVSRDGSNAKNMVQAAKHYGLDCKAFRMSPEKLRKTGGFPCILHWNMNHFVVLCGFRGRHVYINDPARGSTRISWEEFDRAFTGVVLFPAPGPNFVADGKRPSMLDFAGKRLRGASAAVAFVMLATALSYLFGIANSVTARIFLDRLLTSRNLSWLTPLLTVMLVLAALQITVQWVRAVNALRMHGKMAIVGSSSYLWKVLHLPMEFFQQRLAGDIQSRLYLNATVSGTLVNTVAPLLLNTVMMLVYLLLMLKNSPLLTLVGVCTLILNVCVSRIISGKRLNSTRVLLRDRGKLEASTVRGIEMIETIKSGGAEAGFFRRWAGYQASVNLQEGRAERLNHLLGLIPGFLSTLANYMVLVLGVWYVMQGQLTLGTVLMFQGFLGAFLQPAMLLVNAGQTLQEMRSQMERVQDVMEYPEDENVRESRTETEPLEKLRGNLELKNVTFGYSRLAPPLISNFSLSVKTGQRVALVGASGCGKSTISRLISGLYQPWEGEILFDGKPRSAYPRLVMTGSLAVVDQEITLFADTIANNIKLWDPSIADFEMILAARDAQLHDDIMQMSGGYQHKLTSGGRNLSGGQRQRLEIARVLAQDPIIVILDEATSALDARTEQRAVKAITDRGITCIVIAHRLSTIRDCDEILVLDHGQVVERGTHESLMALGGKYAALVVSE